ncbi:MAG: glycosyltransferase family 4 protein [Candidatus Didemnitutus sp.]|nr:glycosyltransferase family 4 protein [Candidatus Didemnitutus sp.]
MNISVSGRFLRVNNPTGTQRSATRLLTATLRAARAGEFELFIPRGAEERAGEIAAGASAIFRRMPSPNGKADHLWEQLLWPAMSRARTLLSLMGTGPILHPGHRHIMVVHDINFMLLPQVFTPAFRVWYRYACGQAARRADAIICFSAYVKRSLINRLGIVPERIHVIYQGPGIDVETLRNSEMPAPRRPYFLCVGSLQPHKNLKTILAAWARLNQEIPDFELKIVGRRQSRFSVCDFAHELAEARNVTFTGYINDTELASAYKGATAFIYPSLEEGFGLPIVEAFYSGCPVITSNCSCLPEIAGDAAWQVNPQSVEELVEAMRKLANSPSAREKLITRGLSRAGLFSWPAAGAQLAEKLNIWH